METAAGPVRLQKVLARAGVASRRHAESLIAAGRVRVNGRPVVELGTRVDPARDRIEVDGRPVVAAREHVYLALNKPPGVITTARDPHGRTTVLDLAPSVPGLIPVGRLDAASEGLLLLTTDGEWALRVSHPRYGAGKEYVVTVDGVPDATALDRLRRPLPIGGGERTSGAEVDLVRVVDGGAELRIVLHEGRNRQIRRMMETVGHPVRRLVRVCVGGVQLGTLRPGAWRNLTARERALALGQAAGPPATRGAAAGRPRAGRPGGGGRPAA